MHSTSGGFTQPKHSNGDPDKPPCTNPFCIKHGNADGHAFNKCYVKGGPLYDPEKAKERKEKWMKEQEGEFL